MLSKDVVIIDADDIVLVVFVFTLQIFQKLKLDPSLMLESFLISNHLNCDHLFVLVIVTFQSLTETSRSKFVNDFKSIS